VQTAGRVICVAAAPGHGFSKQPRDSIRLIEGLGVEGDAHAGASVTHRSRVKPGVFIPNLRQVHLIHMELLEELAIEGFEVAPGDLGENITTSGLDLLALPRCTQLSIGDARIEITGLRNPCRQIEAFRPGLLARLARKQPDGSIERLAGVMGVVRAGGEVRCGDAVIQHLPPGPHQTLKPV
jgi:MOSC domain-containing protein YiiM